MSIVSEPGERWLPIPGYDGDYEVSSHGRVLSHMPPTNKYPETPRLIGGSINYSGNYPSVSLTRNRKAINVAIHQLVALTFIGPPGPGQQVRHLDGNSLNPRLENLAYGSNRDNVQDRERHRLERNGGVYKCHKGHELTDKNKVWRERPRGGYWVCITCRSEWRAQKRKRIRAEKEAA